jgi:cephalosporin hydroxylase
LTQVTIKGSANCYQHGRVLYSSLTRYARERCGQHLNVIETGTARGFSALCLAKALSDCGATGKIITFDLLPHDERIYWNCIRDVAGPCTRMELLQDYRALIERYLVFHRGDTRRALRRMAFPRVHFAFFDSVHTYDHVMAEFASVRGRQHPGDVVVFDDYTQDAFPGVVKAADEICVTEGYQPTRIAASANRRYLVAVKR